MTAYLTLNSGFLYSYWI